MQIKIHVIVDTIFNILPPLCVFAYSHILKLLV